jgi:hypothetical protein
MTRKFQLADLTPATRELYRAYLAACRAARHAGDVMDAAYKQREVPRTTLWHLDQQPGGGDPQVRAQVLARLAAADERYQPTEFAWERACAASTAAFQAAIPAMEAEGYRREWFNTPTGAMRLPRDVQSPGQFRAARASHKIVGGDRVDILAGDERGAWGIVSRVTGGHYHVRLYASESDVRVYTRSELRKPRS